MKKNIDGKLYTYAYGLLTAASLDLIEKKPLSCANLCNHRNNRLARLESKQTPFELKGFSARLGEKVKPLLEAFTSLNVDLTVRYFESRCLP